MDRQIQTERDEERDTVQADRDRKQARRDSLARAVRVYGFSFATSSSVIQTRLKELRRLTLPRPRSCHDEPSAVSNVVLTDWDPCFDERRTVRVLGHRVDVTSPEKGKHTRDIGSLWCSFISTEANTRPISPTETKLFHQATRLTLPWFFLTTPVSYIKFRFSR